MKKLKLELGEKNEILRKVSEKVEKHEFRDYKPLAEAMIKYIKNPKNGWVWLAAPQIWINKRIIVVSLMKDYEDENYRTIAMFNPIILSHSEETECDQEWCLSLPGEKWDVIRYKNIDIEFFDMNWQKYNLSLSNLAARIVQHEIDHLDGILFIDRIQKQS